MMFEEPWGPKASWHLSYRWGKTPKKPHPGNFSRPGIEPGPAAWQARMLSPAPQRWTIIKNNLRYTKCDYGILVQQLVLIMLIICFLREQIWSEKVINPLLSCMWYRWWKLVREIVSLLPYQFIRLRAIQIPLHYIELDVILFLHSIVQPYTDGVMY